METKDLINNAWMTVHEEQDSAGEINGVCDLTGNYDSCLYVAFEKDGMIYQRMINRADVVKLLNCEI